MDPNKATRKEILIVAAGEALVSALCVLVYVLIGKYAPGVMWGAILGAALAILNFVILVLSANKAVKSADAARGQAGMRISYIIRLVLIFALLAVLVKTGLCDPIAAIVPLLLMQPIIIYAEYAVSKEVKTHGA